MLLRLQSECLLGLVPRLGNDLKAVPYPPWHGTVGAGRGGMCHKDSNSRVNVPGLLEGYKLNPSKPGAKEISEAEIAWR